MFSDAIYVNFGEISNVQFKWTKMKYIILRRSLDFLPSYQLSARRLFSLNLHKQNYLLENFVSFWICTSAAFYVRQKKSYLYWISGRFPLMMSFAPFSSVSIIDFEQGNVNYRAKLSCKIWLLNYPSIFCLLIEKHLFRKFHAWSPVL